jgi:hypothetical protein
MNFRHWLERHDLTKVLFDEVGATLEERCPSSEFLGQRAK